MRARGPLRSRRVALATAALGAGLALSACGTSAPPQPHLNLSGVPARSISVALAQVGCTRNDACVAVGSSTTAAGLEATGEFSTPRSPWIALRLPAVDSPSIIAVGCGPTTCLIGGAQPGGDLIWTFSASTHEVTTLAAPSGGAAVEGVSCASNECALIDAAADGGAPRWSLSTDGGESWSTPTPLAWATGDVVTSVACANADNCLVAARDGTDHALAESTSDGGATWTARATPSSWVALSSLVCTGATCLGLAQSGSRSLLVRTTTTRPRWRSTALDGPATSLGCTGARTCVAAGGSGDRPFLEVVTGSVQHTADLRYVPTALVAVACGTKRCAAIGDTTLLDVPSSLITP